MCSAGSNVFWCRPLSGSEQVQSRARTALAIVAGTVVTLDLVVGVVALLASTLRKCYIHERCTLLTMVSHDQSTRRHTTCLLVTKPRQACRLRQARFLSARFGRGVSLKNALIAHSMRTAELVFRTPHLDFSTCAKVSSPCHRAAGRKVNSAVLITGRSKPALIAHPIPAPRVGTTLR